MTYEVPQSLISWLLLLFRDKEQKKESHSHTATGLSFLSSFHTPPQPLSHGADNSIHGMSSVHELSKAL